MKLRFLVVFASFVVFSLLLFFVVSLATGQNSSSSTLIAISPYLNNLMDSFVSVMLVSFVIGFIFVILGKRDIISKTFYYLGLIFPAVLFILLFLFHRFCLQEILILN
ncbi:MAG TPA: hypothetical protein VG895_01370 [Patescibacteria group bacterium]|nr:hypothetical protein [Patescibacteria group bacterium]